MIANGTASALPSLLGGKRYLGGGVDPIYLNLRLACTGRFWLSGSSVPFLVNVADGTTVPYTQRPRPRAVSHWYQKNRLLAASGSTILVVNRQMERACSWEQQLAYIRQDHRP